MVPFSFVLPPAATTPTGLLTPSVALRVPSSLSPTWAEPPTGFPDAADQRPHPHPCPRVAWII